MRGMGHFNLQVTVMATFLLSTELSFTSGCVRTSDVPTTTTTMASTGCSSCTASQVNVHTGDPNDPDPHDPIAVLGTPENGCNTLVVSCSPLTGNPISLLTFQNGLGGPEPGNPSNATLVCDSMGQWTYTGFEVNQPTTVITDAYCLG